MLERADFQALDEAPGTTGGSARIKLLENLLRSSARIVARLSRESLAAES